MGYDMTAEKFRRHVDDMADLVAPWLFQNPDVTHLVGRGVSGQLMLWPLAYKLGLNAMVVRKPNEDAHGKNNVGFGDMKNYAGVDDFIETGSTIRAIVGGIDAQFRGQGRGDHEPRMKAIILYNERRDKPFGDWPDVPVFGKYP
ncbi:MAG TPA: phosphoribosyltransferase [Candidatus Paceibacterota bacterium]